MMDLVGVPEIADELGVSRTRVYQLTARKDFPKPVAKLMMGTIWKRQDIQRWATTWTRKTGRPSSQTAPS